MPEIVKAPNLRWTPVHTRPRCEKVLAEYCRKHDIAYYLPLVRRAKRYQRRTVVSMLPMFGGYLFVQIDAESQSIVLQSGRAVSMIAVDDFSEEQLIQELGEIQKLEQAASEREVIVMPELAPGSPVVIAGGPLAGLKGIVERRRDRVRVTVNIELLGQSASVDLDVGELVMDRA